MLKNTTFYIVFGVVSFAGIFLAGADGGNQAFQIKFHRDPIVWGDPTNDIRSGILVSYNEISPVWIVIYAQRAGDRLPIVFPGTNFVSDPYQHAPTYLGATNWFCGPIELLDAAGKKLPLLQPAVSSAVSYPDSLSWANLRELKWHQMRPPHAEPGNHGLAFLYDTNWNQINSFYLTNYYKIEKTGEYRLTVWPKLYKHSANDKDVYQRIDIPPVTVAIKWQ